MKEIRMGIIGCGNMCTQHLASFEALKGKMRVAATCDLSADRAERAMEMLGADRFFTDYREMGDAVDAVLIALPHRLHYPVGRFFIEHGKHVLMEKPLCIRESECLALTNLAKEKGVQLMTAYPVRFWPETLKLKELMDAGTVGEVFQMTVYTDHWNPARDTRGTWMTCQGLGGGQFLSHGCHYVDILLWFLGKPVSGTHMGTNTGTPWMDREGTSHAVIKFENGALGYHTGTWGARGTTHRYKVDIYGTDGTLSYTNEGPDGGKIRLLRTLGYEAQNAGTEVLWEKNASGGKRTDGEIEHFIECIRTGQTPITDGQSSLCGLRCIWKMYEAEASGAVADLRGLGLNDPFIDTPICRFDCDSPEALGEYRKEE